MKFLSSLVHWSLNNQTIVLGLTVIFLFFGIDSARKLKIDAVPDITTIQVQVITTAPALSPIEIEKYVTYPVERAMAGLPKLVEVRSISRYGISVVTIVFQDDTDIFRARQWVSERLKEAEANIPPSYGIPTMGPISTGLGEIFQFTLTSDKHSLLDLTTQLNWFINPILKTVPGVVEVNTFGGESKEYQIILDLNKMQSLGFSGMDVLEALRKNNAATGGGYIEKEKEHIVIGSDGLISSLEDISKIYVGKTKDGFPVTISSIADVKIGHKLRRGATSKDGKGEVTGAITMMLMKENSLQVTESIKKKLEEIKPFLAPGMKIESFYDRSEMVKKTIRTVIINLLEGAILVIVVLFFMLGNFRAGLVIALTIPLAMLFAISIMRVRDAPGNLMSMGAIDFGLIVDGAVILVENSYRRLSLKTIELKRALTFLEKKKVIFESTVEVRKATIYGEIIIAIVYLPILALSGVEGKMFIPMALTVLYALLGAFILTLTVVPVLALLFLKPADEKEHETIIFQKLKIYYEPLLEKAFQNPKKIIFGTLGGFVFSLILFYFSGGEFIPQLDEGSLLLEVNRLPSASLTESLETSKRIERILLKNFPEITNVVSRTGSPDIATDPMGIDRSDIYLVLKPKEDWRFSKNELIEKISETLEKYTPEVAFSISQPIQMRTNELIAGVRSDVGIKIYGEDLSLLKQIGEEVSHNISKIPGVVDIKIEQLKGLSYLKVVPNRESLSRYGISIDEVNQAVEMISSGNYAGNIFEENKRFSLVIKAKDDRRNPLDRIKSFPIRSHYGQTVPLSDLAEIYTEEGPVQISHEHQSRRMIVEFNIRGKDMVSVIREVEEILQKKLKFPAGFRYDYGGKYENYISARNTLLIIVPLTLIVILFVLWVAFGEMKPAWIIFLNVPFAITGGVISLYIRGIPFSISAGVGFIALFGVAVLNGLVLVSFTKKLEHEGKDSSAAIFESAKLRLRPVVTTAVVAALGFLPMALSTSMGAEVQRPLATVVIGGLITSSILTLFVLPIIYLMGSDQRKK
ncbi:MAG: CusA/CzcA family heavy metal efflux RND transporter [Leptospiraceae bacterium]|nr:efflux RND transporter permease subunit [Leptospiraceae bacterium]MCK6380422.1 CusA/CzcA family heavy metal efflux RND transporter [Leptospiraceae bacterium]NUM41182.1 efflux RND transporter permease subunit [Leptospiraceae bacterium]